MSSKAVGWAMQQRIPPTQKMVLFYISEHANTNTDQAWPSIDCLAFESGFSRQTVISAIDALIASGLITKSIRTSLSGSVSNLYWVDRSRQIGAPVWAKNQKSFDHSETAQGVKKVDGGGSPTAGPDGVKSTPKEGVQSTDAEGVKDVDPNQVPHEPSTSEHPGTLFAMPVEKGKTRKVPDTAFHQVIAESSRLYELANPGVSCEWGGLAFNRLSAEIKKKPKWSIENWLNAVRNRFKSENINPADPPENFVPKLAVYVSGPLNEFGKPYRGGNSSHGVQSRNQQSAAGTLDRIREAAGGGEGEMDYQPDYSDGGSHWR